MSIELVVGQPSVSSSSFGLFDDPHFHFLSIHNDDRPSTISECVDPHGNHDPAKFMQYLVKDHELRRLERNIFFSDNDETLEPPKKKQKARSCKSLCPYYYDAKGNIHLIKPRSTVWYLAYVLGLPQGKLHDKFRKRFRMPHTVFLVLLEEVKRHSLFSRWLGADASGRLASPMALLLLGSLRYLGRGLTFDDLEEFTAVGEETHRQFFHKFIQFGRTFLYPQHVQMPVTAQEYETHRAEFATGGLHGCGFSSDATNVIMWRCSDNLKQANMGFKQSHPVRTYDMTCNHRRRILHTTSGSPARWNDKTLAMFNEFLSKIHDGRILSDVTFELCSWEGLTGSSRVVKVKYSGAWGLCDNGYRGSRCDLPCI